MKFLISPNSETKKAHLWDDGDTYCRQYSTGGMRKKGKVVVDDPGSREVCANCKALFQVYNPGKALEVQN